MRSTVVAVTAAAVLASIAGTASAQTPIVVDTNLGTLAVGSSTRLTGAIAGVDAGNADIYGLQDGSLFGTTVADERVYQFTTTARTNMSIAQNAPFTGTGTLLIFLLDSLQTQSIATTIGTFSAAIGGIDLLAGSGAFPAGLNPGTYYIAIDPFTGQAPIVPANAAGTFDVNLNIAAFVALNCGTASGFQVNTNLGALPDGTLNLVGDTTSRPDNVCAYANAAGALLVAAPYNFREQVYQFSLATARVLDIENNEGIFVGVDHEHFLLDGLAVTPGADFFGDGTAFGTRADNAIGVVDEEGTFGLVGAGTYYLAIDGFDGNGAFDINLVVSPAANCGTGTPTANGGTFGAQQDGDFITVTADTSAAPASSTLCGYRDSTGGFLGFAAEFNELIVGFSTDAAATGDNRTVIGIFNFEGAGVGVDHDHYLLDGLAFTTGFDLFGDGTVVAQVADNTIGFVDEEGNFPAVADGSYFVSVDGFDGNGAVDIDITFDAITALPDVIDVATEAAGQMVGQIGTSAAPVTVELCTGTDSTVDTWIGVYNADTGDFIGANDDGCNAFGPSQFTVVLPAGNYVLSIGSFTNDGSFPWADGLVHQTSALDPVAGAVNFNNVATLPFSAPAFGRDVFTFSIGAGVVPLPAGTVDLGDIAVDADNLINIDTCAANYDTEVGVWFRDGVFLGSNDDSAFCGTSGGVAAPQSALAIDFSDANGDFDPTADGDQLVFSVSGFNTIFAQAFGTTQLGTEAGNYGLNINGQAVNGSTGSGQIDYFVFTVRPPAGNPGCNLADVAEDFNSLDINDILVFADAFDAGNADIADVTGEGDIDINDILTFADAFDAGCP